MGLYRFEAVSQRSGNTSRLSELEFATGLLLGPDFAVPDPGHERPSATPLAALEAVLRPILEVGNCYVSFSGGRDSSGLLAVAAALAKREGLAPPIALTMVWPEVLGSHESEWQEEVIAHVGVEDWLRIPFGEETDLVGPIAQQAMRRHGLCWPPAAYGNVPAFRAAAGGTLVTGDGGDQVFGQWRNATLGNVAHRRRALARRDLPALLRLVSPRAAVRALERRRRPPYQTWLQPAPLRRYAQLRAQDKATHPRSWPGYLRWVGRRRDTSVMVETWRRYAADDDCRLVLPIWDAGFLATLAAAGGVAGLGGRPAVMRAVFGDLLPDHVHSRRSKANFTRAYFSTASEAFAREWDGTGVDPELVDPDRLRAAWLSEWPPYGSASLLQALFYARHIANSGDI